MIELKEPSITEVEKFLLDNGKRGSMTIKLLAKLSPFIQAMNSPIGREILKDDIDRHEELLNKIYNENATPQEMAEFRFLKGRLQTISQRFSQYVSKAQEVVNK